MKRICILAFLLAPALARAEPEPIYHANAGFEFLGGNALSYGFRAQALVGMRVGTGGARVAFAAGGTYSKDELQVHDVRGLDGSVTVDLGSYGPEALVGIDLEDGTLGGTELYSSFALLHVDPDPRLKLDMLPGVSSDGGTRAAVGANFAHAVGRYLVGDGMESKEDAGRMLVLLLPQQVEVAWERDAGSSRVGVALSWGL